MTGFRLAFGGAQELYGIQPDLTTMGKIIGGGLTGRGLRRSERDQWTWLLRSAPMYQAGTLSGNPLAMAAGLRHALLPARTPGKSTQSWISLRPKLSPVSLAAAKRCRSDHVSQPSGVDVYLVLRAPAQSQTGRQRRSPTPKHSDASSEAMLEKWSLSAALTILKRHFWVQHTPNRTFSKTIAVAKQAFAMAHV